MIASDNGHFDVVKTLIDAGANVNQANKVGTHVRIDPFRWYEYSVLACLLRGSREQNPFY